MAERILVRTYLVRTIPEETAGFSERAVRRHYERRGFEVWRARFLDEFFSAESPFVKYHYAKYFRALELLRAKLGPLRLVRLAKFCASHHGTPDFLVWHKAGLLRFVEAKLGHEALSPRQYRTCHYLLALGLEVELARVAAKPGRAPLRTLSPVGERTPLVASPRLAAFGRHGSRRALA